MTYNILLRAFVISAIVIGFWTTPDASADEGWSIYGNTGASIFRADASDTGAIWKCLSGCAPPGDFYDDGVAQHGWYYEEYLTSVKVTSDKGFFVSGAAGYSWAQEAGAKMLVIVHNARIGGRGLAERAIASVYDGDIIFGKELMAVPL